MENLVKKYLDKHKMTQTEFARRVGTIKQVISWHILNPKAKWNPDMAIRIERATSGEILAYNLIFRHKG